MDLQQALGPLPLNFGNIWRFDWTGSPKNIDIIESSDETDTNFLLTLTRSCFLYGRKTCVARAWNFKNKKPFIVAPAMNTHMWEHPMTDRWE